MFNNSSMRDAAAHPRNYSFFLYENLGEKERAVSIAREAFEDAWHARP